MSALTAEEIRSFVSYNTETGDMRWLPRRLCGKATNWDTKYAGRMAGTRNKLGYWFVRIHQKSYPLHRLAWLYVHGVYPDELDHANGNPSDNRLSNLREATRTQQLGNTSRRSDNTSGFKGVYRFGDRWRAKINVSGKQIHLGTFPDRESGHLAYAEAAQRYFGEFARAA